MTPECKTIHTGVSSFVWRLVVVGSVGLVTWLACVPRGRAQSQLAADFQQIELARGVPEMGEPMSLAVLPDRSVLHTARSGQLRRTDAAGNTTLIAELAVYVHDEEGLQGIGIDPDFAHNRFIYLYYAPPLSTPGGNAPAEADNFAVWAGVNRLARFKLNADFSLDMKSEVSVLEVPADRGLCCHVGGDIDFDAQGNLYLTTGDNTNPYESSGYAPLDERAQRHPAHDAQRSAGNTNDLRGKLLRIRVNADGKYTIPSGNLFPPGTPHTRPEIYAMGFRNPFRMSVDRATGVVYLGDYGPDAAKADPKRGPAGQVEWNRIASAGNYGWPYCTGSNSAAETYHAFKFPSGPSGALYDCANGATNGSFRNTGLRKLPPARPAWITYDDCSVAAFGCGSESPMAGPIYRYDAALASTAKFPASFDGLFFATEFGRRWIKTVRVGLDGSAGEIEAFPWSGTQIIDSAFGPDGALYVLDYGTGFFNGNGASALYRIEYSAAGNRAPSARLGADQTSGLAPLTVHFSAAGSSDPEGGALTYQWDLGADQKSNQAEPTATYGKNGQYHVKLTVTDPAGRTSSTERSITVGNTAPLVTLIKPRDGELIAFGESVPFEISVTDPEDGDVDCARVQLTYILGHDSHGHPLGTQQGCTGVLELPAITDHDSAANTFAVFAAQYADLGAGGQPALTSLAQHIGAPWHRQAEHFTSQSGVTKIPKPAAQGGMTVGNIDAGDWIAFTPYLLERAARMTARVSSAGAGGKLSVRVGSPQGAPLGSASVPVTGGWASFVDISLPLANVPAESGTLYLTFEGGHGALFDLDSFTFVPDEVESQLSELHHDSKLDR